MISLKRLLKRKRYLSGMAIAIVIGLTGCLAFNSELFYSLQRQSSDFLFRTAAGQKATSSEEKVVIIGIDDKSLEQLGHLSLWPRTHYATLIDILTEAKARIIVFDILFSEPAPGDEELAASIRKAGNVLLPVASPPQSNSLITPQAKDLVRPLDILEREALALGHANVIPDGDGLVRRMAVAVRNGDGYESSLSLAAVAKYLRRPAVFDSYPANDTLPFAGRSIPLVNNGTMVINYLGYSPENEKAADFLMVSFVDIINNEVDISLFQDKIVIIGAAAVGLGDAFWTPMGRTAYGIEIHAHAINTILEGAFLKPVAPLATMALMLGLVMAGGLLVLRLRTLWSAVSAFFMVIIYFVAAFSLFDRGIMLNMLYPPLAIAGAFAGLNIYKLAAEQAEKTEITETFGRFISPSVVDRILFSLREGEVKLGGDVHEVTVAFADIRGFSGIAEKMPPEELVQVLNIYLSVFIKTVLRYGGIINKFGGDSVMAVWNVPVECNEHARLAIEASVSAQRAVKKLQDKEGSLPKFEFGIGVNTGKAIAGNLGSKARLEYSVIGDTVNTAARITGATPGGSVWIGANTFDRVKEYITAQPLEPMRTKGKTKPIQAYEVMDIRQWHSPEAED